MSKEGKKSKNPLILEICKKINKISQKNEKAPVLESKISDSKNFQEILNRKNKSSLSYLINYLGDPEIKKKYDFKYSEEKNNCGFFPSLKIQKNGMIESISNDLAVLGLLVNKIQAILSTEGTFKCICCRTKLDTQKCKFNTVTKNYKFYKTFFYVLNLPMKFSKLNQQNQNSIYKNNCIFIIYLSFLLNHSCRSELYFEVYSQFIRFLHSKYKKTSRKKRKSIFTKRGFNKVKIKVWDKFLKKIPEGAKFLENQMNYCYRMLVKKKKKPENINNKIFQVQLIKIFILKVIENQIILGNISLDAGKQLLKNLLQKDQLRVFVIDCRYKYEFDGGHVKGAININDPDVIKKLFFDRKYTSRPGYFQYLADQKNIHIDIKTADHILKKSENLFETEKKRN